LPAMLDYESGLAATLARLPGRKVVFSNGPRHYARAVLKAMGLLGCFDRIYAIECVGFRPKPDLHGFRRVLRREGVRPQQAVMVDDSADNVRAAKRLGMRTVWISGSGRRLPEADLILRSVRELPRALRTGVRRPARRRIASASPTV
jgi:putative hydrolase of the HAD superfamily